MNTMFNGMFMKVQKGMCMLSPCGIAVRTTSGYRSYDIKSGKLRNCDNLVFSFGDGMFFVIPSTKVKPGDIILNGGKPACVRSAGKNSIEVINYETSVVETILPERHIFMGSTWFYGKIVSLFGDGSSICGKGGLGKMMKLMMISAPGAGNMNALMPLLLMKGGGFDDLFGGLFDEDDKDTEDIDLDAEDDEDLLF